MLQYTACQLRAIELSNYRYTIKTAASAVYFAERKKRVLRNDVTGGSLLCQIWRTDCRQSEVDVICLPKSTPRPKISAHWRWTLDTWDGSGVSRFDVVFVGKLRVSIRPSSSHFFCHKCHL